MLCEKESITEENETEDVQNSGLKASNQGVIFLPALLRDDCCTRLFDRRELSVPVTALQQLH